MSVRQSVAILFSVLTVVINAHAQGRIVTTSKQAAGSSSIEGFKRDFWFSLLKQGDGGGGRYFEAYITSATSAIVEITLGKSSSQRFPIKPQEVLVYRLPLAWEMQQSAVVEDKAVHVWSDNADLVISLLSHSSFSADGLSVLPVASWGKEYVIAAYASFAYYAQNDYPSEFAIVASEDNTTVMIKPSCDLREGLNPGVAYPAHQTVTVTLNRGQSVQYQASVANGNEEDHDVTGTVISSNKPIGVEAGVVSAFVPVQTPYADHLCEMLTPIDRWGKSYYTAPFALRKGGDGFLVIAAEDNTRITRTAPSGTTTHAILNKFDSYMRFDIDEPSRWISDKPFMLVQYMLGEDYPDAGVNEGVGAPSMVVIPATSLYQKNVIFNLPKVSAGSAQYTNYTNLIVHKNAAGSTKLDGQSIVGLSSSKPIPSADYIVFLADSLGPGSHTLSSDSGVGIYSYGYGSSESYAWPGPMTAFATSRIDTIPPDITSLADQCYTLDVRVADIGNGALGRLMSSVDSISNFSLTSIIQGLNRDSLSYGVSVMDSSRSAYARLTIVDAAGNRRIIVHRYNSDLPYMPEGVYAVRIPLNSTMQFALPIAAGQFNALNNIQTSLKSGAQFQILTSPTDVPAGYTDSIRIKYDQISINDNRDTLIISADCWRHEIALRGSPTPITAYAVQDTMIDFGLVLLGNSRSKTDKVFNIGTEPFTIDSITLESEGDYELLTGQLPAVVPRGDTVNFEMRFVPIDNGVKGGRVTIFTSIGKTLVRLTGQGGEQAGVIKPGVSTEMQIYPNPVDGLLKVSIGEEWAQVPLILRVSDLGGRQILNSVAIPTEKSELDLDVHMIPAGTYLLELEMSSGMTVGGKFVIER